MPLAELSSQERGSMQVDHVWGTQSQVSQDGVELVLAGARPCHAFASRHRGLGRALLDQP